MALVAEFNTTISPAELKRATGREAAKHFDLNTRFSPATEDPNGPYTHKKLEELRKPSQCSPYRVEIHSETDGSAYLTIKPENSPDSDSVTLPLVGRHRLTDADIRFAREKPLIVHPVVAALATYDNHRGDLATKQIDFGDLNLAGCKSVRDFLASGGLIGARNLNVQAALPAGQSLTGLFAIADWMDTASRTPPRMSAAFIREALTWSSQNVIPGTCLWLGTGSENVPLGQRVEYALQTGAITTEQYVAFRREQLRFVKELGHVPILFPDQMQNGLDAKANISLINQLLSTFLGEIVLHKLGKPFLEPTGYLTNEVLQDTAGNGYAVKSSHPGFPYQMEDDAAIQLANDRNPNRRVVMHTGDDRGFAYDFYVGAVRQARLGGPSNPNFFINRNGYKFVNDRNISALLGYLGLNPHQSIAAIIRLSQHFHEVVAGSPESPLARKSLQDFWDLMAPAMLLSQRSFFGPFQPTPAYTGHVELSHRFAGVLHPEDGHPLPHRDISLQGRERQALARDHLLAHVYAGAVTAEELPEVMGNNRELLGV
jgi:hypothetical protein